MEPDDELPTIGGTPTQVHLQLAQARLDSQKRIERNTFWTMIAVAAHTGYGVITSPTVQQAAHDVPAAIVFLMRVLVA